MRTIMLAATIEFGRIHSAIKKSVRLVGLAAPPLLLKIIGPGANACPYPKLRSR